MAGNCEYCRNGNKPKNGKHWIVTSLVPARVTVRDCRDYTQEHQTIARTHPLSGHPDYRAAP